MCVTYHSSKYSCKVGVYPENKEVQRNKRLQLEVIYESLDKKKNNGKKYTSRPHTSPVVLMFARMDKS